MTPLTPRASTRGVTARLGILWAHLYTFGMAAPVRRRRIAEIRSWSYEQRLAARQTGQGRLRTELQLLTTALHGLIDDLAWRREQTRFARELTGASQHHKGSFMDKLLQDIGLALRTVLRSPGFALTAILTLSLGIGANVAIFALTNTMLLRTLPYPDGERLVMLWETMPDGGFDRLSMSPLNFVDWREQQTSLADLAALQDVSFTLLSGGDPERVEGVRTSAALFDILGVRAAHGRVYSETEDRPGAEPVVLMSDGLWTRRFGADPDVVGSTINIDGAPHTVLGVMPPDFNFPREEHLWVPLALDAPSTGRASHNLDVIARLREGVSIEQAQAELSGIAARLSEAYPESNEGFGANVVSLREEEIGDERILVYVLSGVVGFVLLIACANVANLTLARASARRREIAVRAALGAGRGRLVRQLLTESLVLATVAGVIGLFVGTVGNRMIVAAFPPGVPTWLNWNFDATVYGFLVAVTLITGVLFGFVPALQASRGNPGSSLRSVGRSGGGRRRSWFRSGLVVAEVALAMILLIGAGLMVRAYINVNAVDPGFDPDDLVLLRVSLPAGEYGDAGAQTRFWSEIIGRMRAVPGVTAAAGTSLLPVGSFQGTYLAVEGSEPSEGGVLPVVTYARISPGYVETIGIPLVEGRTFHDGDGAEGTPEVLLVSRTAAERFWPDQSPLGKRVKFGPLDDPESEFKTVIGVVEDVMQTGIGDPAYPGVYVPVSQSPGATMNLLARIPAGVDGAVAAIRDAVWQIDDQLPVYDVTTMRARIAENDWEQKLFTRIFSSFAVIALVLASVGLYGLISYSVNQRTREIGVRMALGADRGKVVGLVVRQGMKLTVVGLLLGLIGAFGVTGVIGSLLFGVSPTDPLTFGGIFALLVAVAGAASYLPARRATRVDPVAALRQ